MVDTEADSADRPIRNRATFYFPRFLVVTYNARRRNPRMA
jgi:hypothetical protein